MKIVGVLWTACRYREIVAILTEAVEKSCEERSPHTVRRVVGWNGTGLLVKFMRRLGLNIKLG